MKQIFEDVKFKVGKAKLTPKMKRIFELSELRILRTKKMPKVSKETMNLKITI